MRTLVSRIDPSGYLVVAHLPQQAQFIARFADSEQERDITASAADLLLTAVLEQLLTGGQDDPAPADEVPVAHLTYRAPLLPGQAGDGGVYLLVRTSDREGTHVPAEHVLPLIARGVALAITAQVAADADLPEDPSALERPTDA